MKSVAASSKVPVLLAIKGSEASVGEWLCDGAKVGTGDTVGGKVATTGSVESVGISVVGRGETEIDVRRVRKVAFCLRKNFISMQSLRTSWRIFKGGWFW